MSSTETPRLPEGLAAAARAAAEGARDAEAERRLPAAVVEAFLRAGVFKLLVPRSLGGAEVDVATWLACMEELARADGSAGWCAYVSSSSGIMSAYLDEPTARDLYGPADATSCGVFAPLGI